MSLDLVIKAVSATLPKNAEAQTRIPGAKARAGADTYRPQAYVYIDFLRPVMVDNRYGAAKLRAQEAQRDAETVATFYYRLAKLFATIYDLDKSRRPVFETDSERQQDFINLMLNRFLTQINVNRNKTSTGTCSITFDYNSPSDSAQDPMRAPLLSLIDQLLTPHIHMEVWGVGRFYRDKVYPMFAGMTSSIGIQQTTVKKLTVECEDYTKLMRISDVIVNPAYFAPELQKADPRGLVISGNVFYGASAQSIISQLVTGTQTRYNKKGKKVRTRGTAFGGLLDYKSVTKADEIAKVLQSAVMDKRVLQIPSKKFRFPRKLLMWGVDVTPYRVFSFTAFSPFRSQMRNRFEMCRDVATRLFSEFYCDAAGNIQFHPMRISSTFLVNSIIGKQKVVYKRRIKARRVQAMLASATTGGVFEWVDVTKYADAVRDRKGNYTAARLVRLLKKSSLKSRLPANATPNISNYGEAKRRYVSKSYKKHVAARHDDPDANPYIIPDTEIIDLTETISDKELITSLILRGDNILVRMGGPAELLGLVGHRNNKRMIQQFGFRRKEISCPMMHGRGSAGKGKKKGWIMTMFADAHFALINGEMTTANLSMPMRPEIDVARPVALSDRNLLYYINSVTHTFSAGQEAMTSLGLSFGRRLTDADSINFFDHLVVTDRSTARMSTASAEKKFRKYLVAQENIEAQKAGERKQQNASNLTSSATRVQRRPDSAVD